MSTWGDLEGVLSGIAPTVGTLIGGPVGGAVGLLVSKVLGCDATPDAVSQALATNPNAAVQLKQLEVQEATTLTQLKQATEVATIQADTSRQTSVDGIISTEAKGDSWLQRNWHPIGCLVVIALIVSLYFLFPLLTGFGLVIAIPVVPEAVWMMLGAILGVTAWQAPNMLNAKKN